VSVGYDHYKILQVNQLSTDVNVVFEGRKYVLAAFPDDHITRWLQLGRFYEEDLLRAIRDLDVRGPYVDVGAFIGTHATFFACECPASKVIAIEPNPEAFELLLRNTARHPGITSVHAAAHDCWQTAAVVHRDAKNRGMATIIEGGPIRVVSVDAMEVRAALLKIDVEGMELAVLRSARETLLAHPVVVAEAATDVLREAIDRHLEPLGYRRAGPYARTPTYIWTSG
jgi:FkbM family methyltransferase